MSKIQMLDSFYKPPKGYGEVAFFWWHGDTITKEKLSWILEQLKDAPISGLQINYCHSDRGGLQWGLTLESEPKPLSEPWWELFGWFIGECEKYGIALSLSDYTLGAPGQGFYTDEVLSAHPEFLGQRLSWDGENVRIDKVPNSLNPMAIGTGDAIADQFYGAFERHFPDACGSKINYFFSDELNFNIRGNLWCDDFAKEFISRKGYDIMPKLRAIFVDIGDETEKIRLDYYDVIVQLSEERYFKPVHYWHADRGMTFGCDHGGRGKDVTEFGDYFRTMKWNGAPGNDQPKLYSDIIKTKVSASICHLYDRERTWLEGFYASGWGTSTAMVSDAVFRNYGLGHNLLSLHGLYYSTNGSRWEWAPPCNHFHMPYWTEMPHLLRCTERLSWLLSKGKHCCDVAVIYPVAPVEAYGEEGNAAVWTAFAAAEKIYRKGIDFDFIDFESVERADIDIESRALNVNGNSYKAVIIPNMKAVRFGMFKRLAEFAEKGGRVIILGNLPISSDNAGRNDPALDSLCETVKTYGTFTDIDSLPSVIRNSFVQDFFVESPDTPFFQHRRFPDGEMYYIYGLNKGVECTFRASGTPLLLDPWSGKAAGILPCEHIDGLTRLNLPCNKEVPNILLFVEEVPEDINPLDTQEGECLDLSGLWTTTIEPTLNNKYGDYRIPATDEYIGVELPCSHFKIIENGEEISSSLARLSYGPQLWTVSDKDITVDEAIALTEPDEKLTACCFSWRYGLWTDSGDQHSYHGLKGIISDDFLTFGKQEIHSQGSKMVYSGEGGFYAFGVVSCEEDAVARVSFGNMKPDRLWINHKPASGERVALGKGKNCVVAHFATCGKTHMIFLKGDLPFERYPQSMSWYNNPNVLPFDAHPERKNSVCRFIFTAPAGMLSMEVPSDLPCEAWCNGEKMLKDGRLFKPMTPAVESAEVILEIREAAGRYEGGTLDGFIKFNCGKGLMPLGDWSEVDSLRWYSGGIRYERDFSLAEIPEKQVVDLGRVVSTARIYVNGELADILCTAPFKSDITRLVRSGENHIEILIHNTLANHMNTVPTVYWGSTESGAKL